MGGDVTPKTPPRADQRYIHALLDTVLAGKVEHVPAEYDLLSRVFLKAGGSWSRLFKGSPVDVDLLKRVCRRAFKLDLLTKKRKWEAKS